MGRTIEQRFWEKVEQSPTNDCLVWTGAVNPKQYGKMTVAGKTVSSHRLVYELYIDRIPKDFEIDHLCRNHSCVNPNHLEAVTRKENMLRGYSFTSINAQKTHCIHGHEFNQENTRFYTRNGREMRECRTCAKTAMAKFHATHKSNKIGG